MVLMWQHAVAGADRTIQRCRERFMVQPWLVKDISSTEPYTPIGATLGRVRASPIMSSTPPSKVDLSLLGLMELAWRRTGPLKRAQFHTHGPRCEPRGARGQAGVLHKRHSWPSGRGWGIWGPHGEGS